MFKRVLSVVIAILMFSFTATDHAYARPKQEKEAHQIEKVKQNTRKLGAGPGAKVEVKLTDNRKLKGYIKEAGEDDFILIEEKTGGATAVAYSQVKQIKRHNALTAGKVAINIVKGVGIVAGVALGFTLLGLIFIPRT